jgi:hypothetical protein
MLINPLSASALPLTRPKMCDPIFSGWLRAAAKMASVVTLIIEKNMKKYFKKNLFPTYTDPNFFAI